MRPADPMPPSSDFLRRRLFSLRSASAGGGKASAGGGKVSVVDARARPAQASDAFLIPLRFTNIFFILLFFVASVFLMGRWRDKIRTSTPLHILTSAEIASTVAFFASVIYLLDFFGIVLVQSVVSRPHDDDADVVADFIPPQCPAAMPLPPTVRQQQPLPADDEGVVAAVVAGAVPSYALEARLGDCKRAVVIRRAALERLTGRSLEGLPVDGFNYQSILGQCCEMPVGYVQLPVGIAGPLLLDGREFSVPMATTEGCLVASTNRGCKAIYASGGAASVLLRDGMTRAPVVRFGSVKRAAELKFFLEDPINFDTLALVFNR